jgi:Siphovirus Gp157
MSTLRELSHELQEVQSLALDPDVPEEALRDTLDGIEGMFNEKAVRIVHVIANSDTDLDAISAEIKRLSERKRSIELAQDRLREYLRFNMEATGISKISSPLFTITLAAGRDMVEIYDEAALPDEFVRVKTVVSPEKADILKALKSGIEVPGATITKSKSSVRIK